VIDTIVLVGYMCVMLWVGWHSRGQSAESYWVANRQYGTSRISISLVATIFGASSTIGLIGLGYVQGITAAWWSLMGAVALAVFGLALAARVRKLGVYTLPDILHRAYGRMVSVPAALMIVIAWCGIVSAQMIAGARLLSGTLSIGYTSALAIVAVVFILYTFWGGQMSVLKTDVWQLGLFLGGLTACLIFVVVAVQTDFGSILGAAPDGYLSFPISDSFGWYDLLVFFPLIVGLPYLVGPDIYSRVLCAKDDSVAKRSVMISALLVVPIAFMLALLGTLLSGLFPGLVQDAALPIAISELVPTGLAGLIAAGFLAAIMSSADTTLVSASTILSLNVLGARKAFVRDRQLAITRAAVLCVGLVACLIAGFQQDIISALLLAYTVFVGGVVLPTLASFCRNSLRITPLGAMWAVIVGGTVAILGEIQNGAFLSIVIGEEATALLAKALGPGYRGILPIILSLIVMMAVSWASGKRRS
jgi:SSS family solute:Na+ symporter